jgi:ribonuclease HI
MLYTDGASRGNPGPAGIAYQVMGERGGVLDARAERIAVCPNNQAEYQALIAGLGAAARLAATDVTVISDSQLMIRQLRGEYRVKSAEIRLLYTRVRVLENKFDRVEYEYRPRGAQGLAECDRMVNEVLTAAGHPKKPPPPGAFRHLRNP